jgi:hypothetical protein
MCWNGAVPRRLRQLQTVGPALAAVVALALAVAAIGCGGDDDSGTDGSAGAGTAPVKQENGAGKEAERQDAYDTAFKQCKMIGAEALRANYEKDDPLSLQLLAQLYVSRTTYFHPYEQEAMRGCEAALGR